MADGLGVNSEVHELQLGDSFARGENVAFHSMRYDFKPASVDTSQQACVEVGKGHQVTVTVPHVEGSGTSHTLYKGNKRPIQKECVLIIDHATGEFTLEKLNSNIQLKKTRSEGSSKSQQLVRPLTPVEQVRMKEQKSSPSKKAVSKKPQQAQPPPPQQPPPQQAPPQQPPPQQPPPQHRAPASPVSLQGSASPYTLVGEISSSSSSSSSSDSDDSLPPRPSPPVVVSSAPHKKGFHSMLSEDLQLSESGSDSD